jgi:site-specific recombinase XerC
MPHAVARRRWPVGQCRVCLGWGELPQFADCGGCSSWRHQHPDRAACRRCGHDSHLNTDDLCRLCLQVIRTTDPGWIQNPTTGWPCQLRLLLPGLRLPRAQPLDKLAGRGRPHTRERPPSWLARLRVAAAQPVDDPRVCPPVTSGQLVLFRGYRRLTLAQARRIRDRELPDYARVRAAMIASAAERGYGTAWWRAVDLRLRLALAVRDADGEDLVAGEDLDDLPGLADATAEILRRVGLLRPRRSPRPLMPTKPHRSCEHCGSWGLRSLCAQCSQWRNHPVGGCARCHRSGLPLRDGRCRACLVHVEHHGPQALATSWIQLWLGGPLALTLHRHGSVCSRPQVAARRPSPPPVSPHLVNPAQGTLLEARRDWRVVAVGSLEQLPSLTPTAQALLEAFRQHARDQRWHEEVRRLATRSLRILLAFLGADAPIPEADVWALQADRPGTSARRVVEFLAEHGLLIPDPDRQVDPDEQAIWRRLHSLPGGIGEEVGRWVRVLRGEGRRAHPVRSFATIRKYVGYVLPVLDGWADRVTSLREITPDDVEDALKQHTGNTARDLLTALRSLFRALKQERLVFRDPTRGLTLPVVRRLPAPIPTDRLRGLLDRAGGPMARLVVALVAIHGLGPVELTRLHLDNLELARGRLTVHRDAWRHTVYLDPLTHELAAAWLRERHRRWPLTANPHLLVSQQTAAMATCPPVSRLAISLIFRPLGLSPLQAAAGPAPG